MEIIRALLYMEQCDLVVELVRDFCFASIPIIMNDNWMGLIEELCDKGRLKDKEEIKTKV